MNTKVNRRKRIPRYGGLTAKTPSNMHPNQKNLFIACVLALAVLPASAQQQPTRPKLNVLRGPATAHVENIAQIDVPAGYSFIDAAGTQALLKNAGEPVSGQEKGLLQPTNFNWSVIFEFDPIGYVKDADKEKLDPDKLLEQIKEGTREANKMRQQAGSPPLEVVGWEVPPHYDPTTHNLEWAIRATSAGQPILNYKTKLLGRRGVMDVVLVIDPTELQDALPKFKGLLANYSFQSGQTYAEYRSGDKIAEYGLAALIVGGAAVGAAKLGLLGPLIILLKKAWKLVVVAFVAVIGYFKKLYNRITGRGEDQTKPSL